MGLSAAEWLLAEPASKDTLSLFAQSTAFCNRIDPVWGLGCKDREDRV